MRTSQSLPHSAYPDTAVANTDRGAHAGAAERRADCARQAWAMRLTPPCLAIVLLSLSTLARASGHGIDESADTVQDTANSEPGDGANQE